jgi:cell division protein FtsL
MAAGSMSAWMQAWESDLTPSSAARRSAAREAARESAQEAMRIGARSRYARYYNREATARLPEPAVEAAPFPVGATLREVPLPRRRLGLAVLALAFALLVVGSCVVVPVLVSAATTEAESAVGQVEARQKALATETSALAAEISALSSPQRVTELAGQLGLVPAADVSYIAAGFGVGDPEGDNEVAGR